MEKPVSEFSVFN